MQSRALAQRPGGARWRLRCAVLGVVLGCGLAACSEGPGLARSLTASTAQLQSAAAAGFPRQYPLAAGLWMLQVQAPQLRTQAERDSLWATMVLDISGALLPRAYPALLEVEFGLRYEASDHSVRARDLRVHTLHIEGLPARAAQLLQQQAARLAEQALRDVRLYQLRPQDLERLQSWGLQPGALTVTPQGVRLELVEAVR